MWRSLPGANQVAWWQMSGVAGPQLGVGGPTGVGVGGGPALLGPGPENPGVGTPACCPSSELVVCWRCQASGYKLEASNGTAKGLRGSKSVIQAPHQSFSAALWEPGPPCRALALSSSTAVY